MDEVQYLALANEILLKISHNYTFGYFTVDDIIQEGMMIAMESYVKWDGRRPADKFLFVLLSNGLKNVYRKHCRRSDTPCKACSSGTLCGAIVDGMKVCARFSRWSKLQVTRSNIVNMAPIGTNESGETCEEKLLSPKDTVVDKVAYAELLEDVAGHLKKREQKLFKQLIAGDSAKIAPEKLAALQDRLKIIIKELPNGRMEG